MWKSTKEVGNRGEDIACEWLIKRGFLIVERNYRRKWGEIDIITAKDKIIQFVEVKSVTLKKGRGSIGYRPEENVHELKGRRLRRTIQTYLLEKKFSADTELKFHVVLVYMNESTRRARVEMMENIIL